MAGATEPGRRNEAVIETVRTSREAQGRQAGSPGLVQDIDTMTPTMSPRYRGWLSVQAHAKTTEVSELAHSSLGATECIQAHAHRHGTVDTAMCTAAGTKARGLERRKNLVRGKLLVVEGLLLLLQRLNLVLDRNLCATSRYEDIQEG